MNSIEIYLLTLFHIFKRVCLAENQPNKICGHFSEKASKVRFLKPEKLQNHSNEGKGKGEKNERGEGKEEKKKKQWLHSYFL